VEAVVQQEVAVAAIIIEVAAVAAVAVAAVAAVAVAVEVAVKSLRRVRFHRTNGCTRKLAANFEDTLQICKCGRFELI
jgi:hypothetical protein